MKTFLRPLLAAFAFVLAVAAHASVVGQAAPALTFKDLAGNDVSLAALKGKVVVVDFWATWCGPCLAEIPGYVAMQKKYEKDGLVIVGVSLDAKGPKHVQRFVEQNGMNYAVVMGDNDAVSAFGGFEAIPTTFLIGRDGRILHEKTGAMDHADYEAIVKKAL